MSLSVVWPNHPAPNHGYTRLRVPVEVTPPEIGGFSLSLAFKVPYFIYNGKERVLVKHLAQLWNYPLSYQVISKLVKRTGIPKNDLFLESDALLNAALQDANLISGDEAQKKLFYVDLLLIYLVVANKDVLVGEMTVEAPTETRRRPTARAIEDDMITVSQVFPQYGQVEATTPLTHATFLCLNPMTKLQVYRHDGNYRKVYGTSVSAQERELLFTANNYTLYDASKTEENSGSEFSSSSSKKPLGRQKRHVGSVDPNMLDVTENILPGCGLIQEFNVNALCKVPNYFVINGQMSSAQQNALFNPQKPHLEGLDLKFSETSKTSKQLQQILLNNDQEAYHSKYYYFKSYRGPGSGNYKDAAMVNRINRIRKFTPESTPKTNAVTHIPANRVMKPPSKRFNRVIKGLTHEFYSDDNVEVVLERQRRFTEDFTNLEMLHNTLLFNLLVNSYREVSGDTWKCFYRFKQINFEKLYSIEQTDLRNKRRNELLVKQAEMQQKSSTQLPPTPELAELLRPDLTLRFTLPSQHHEIMERLPVELRGEEKDPVSDLSKPIRYVATYPDKTMPDILNQIEVVKLPNANSLAWDNIKKYRDTLS
ncbi:CIC11C00000002235 [Sungouiella intermedia]|uniref:CIC11C00000002235 n=1 Tax=Sungouiella intermedia TaxID=45354 RepID=A0A1L0BPR0_9ASCO|nr:CIC11C00000002235 [[Candida] intermedia]